MPSEEMAQCSFVNMLKKKSYLELRSLKLINFSDLIGYFKMLLAKSESPD